jgi:hypothetical protein
MLTRFGFARLLARRGLGFIILFCVLALPIAQLGAQMTEEERAAALGQLNNQLTVEGASGRFVERTRGSFDLVPEGEPLLLPISNPDRIASAAVGPLLAVPLAKIQDPDVAWLGRRYSIITPCRAARSAEGERHCIGVATYHLRNLRDTSPRLPVFAGLSLVAGLRYADDHHSIVSSASD